MVGSLSRNGTYSGLRYALQKVDETAAVDFQAWVIHGDVEALGRVLPHARAARKAAMSSWRGSFAPNDGDDQQGAFLDRCFLVYRAGFAKPEQVLSEVFKPAYVSLGQIAAYQRWLAGEGGEHVPHATSLIPPAELEEAIVSGLLRTLQAKAPQDFAAGLEGLFRAFKRNKLHWLDMGWRLLGTFGGEERSSSNGFTNREVRWLRTVVMSKETSPSPRRSTQLDTKLAIIVVEDEAEAPAQADALLAAPFATKMVKGVLEDAPGIVSIWLDTTLDPRGTLDGRGGPVGWFDHDYWEATGGPLGAIALLSHASSFAEAALARAAALGVTDVEHIDALYDHRYTSPPGRQKQGWFLGSFPFTRGAPSIRSQGANHEQ